MTWPTFLTRVRIGGALPVELLPTDIDASGRECVRVTMLVPNVTSGEDVTISRVLPLPHWRGERAAAMWVRDQVRWLYRHEADEQVRVDGVAVFEPRHEHG